uniref:Uncharacterized protein n=1 Tax=uncultured prokaryote TaxID=198431 RepID=A0A0H5Q8H4_9ZZZZ|nr:hypothetical protein [uncultured prokaryote]
MGYIIRQEPTCIQSTVWELVPDPQRVNPVRSTVHSPLTRRWAQRHKVNPREKLHLTLSYRGGSEPLYIVGGRGAYGLVSAHTALHDLVAEVTQGEEWYWAGKS